MSLINVLLLNLGLIAGIMLVLWLVSLRLKNSSIVDIFWGVGFVIIVWVSLLAVGTISPRSLLISVLTSLWGLRLAGYLAWRNVGKGEDHRYRTMRERFGRRFPVVSLFSVFCPGPASLYAPFGWADLPIPPPERVVKNRWTRTEAVDQL